MEFSCCSCLLGQFGNQQVVNDEKPNIHPMGKRLQGIRFSSARKVEYCAELARPLSRI